jgi:hypothetical protein
MKGCDLGNERLGEPMITTSLRGIAVLAVEVATLAEPTNSGWGGAAPDALMALIRLLGTLLDEQGDVAVRGLERVPYRGVAVPVDEHRADVELLPGGRSHRSREHRQPHSWQSCDQRDRHGGT